MSDESVDMAATVSVIARAAAEAAQRAIEDLHRQLAEKDKEIAELRAQADPDALAAAYMLGCADTKRKAQGEVMTKRMVWMPIPSSLEYDLITHAKHGYDIPIEYKICRLTETDAPLVPPALPEWEPVPDGMYKAQHKKDRIKVSGEWLTLGEYNMMDTNNPFNAEVALPDDIRLCRRRPKQGGNKNE